MLPRIDAILELRMHLMLHLEKLLLEEGVV